MMNKADVQRTDALYDWCLRRILDFKVRWHGFIKNDTITFFHRQVNFFSTVVSLFGYVVK